MSSQLQAADLAARLNNFPLDRYLYIGGIMRGVAWAAGTLVLLQIVRNFRRYWPRLFPWVLSLFATMITLTTWGRGVLLTNSRANVWDSFFPTFMGIVEFLLFAILAPPELFGMSPSKTESNAHVSGERRPFQSKILRRFHTSIVWFLRNVHAWYFWFFVFALHALFAVLLVNNRIRNTDPELDYAPELHSLACNYMDWMYADRSGALKGAIFSAIFGILMVTAILGFKWARKERKYTKARKPLIVLVTTVIVYVVIFTIPFLIYSDVIRTAEGQRQFTDEEVSRVFEELKRDQNRSQQEPTKILTRPAPSPCRSPPESIFGR